METPQTLAQQDYSSKVDTSRPFRSVKEALAIFGESRLSTKPPTTYNNTNPCNEIITSAWKYSSASASASPSPSSKSPKKDDNVKEQTIALNNLEAELEETKLELKLLKEKGSETEIALATLNVEVNKNLSKLAEAEARKAETATAMSTKSSFDKENLPTLAQFLGIGETERMDFMKKKKKKKPIIPQVKDFIFKKKRASTTLHNPLVISPKYFD